jgi:hypothetical protein
MQRIRFCRECQRETRREFVTFAIAFGISVVHLQQAIFDHLAHLVR